MEILRTEYLNKLELWKDRHFIKILTGIRRSGKSTILKQFQELLTNKYGIASKNIRTYDFNNSLLLKFNWKTLIEEIISKSSKKHMNYIFLDEIQEIKEFEKCVITLFESKEYKFDIYITGSNSKMFSSKLATLFTGRNAPINVYPIPFKSFNEKIFDKLSDTHKLNEYMKYGGLGIIIPSFDNKEVIEQTLRWVFNDTINKDVKKRHKIQNSDGFDKLMNYIYEHIGRQINMKKIEQYLKSSKEPLLTDKTVLNYLT
jgi:predicted AAA+ superfamily ATPase